MAKVLASFQLDPKDSDYMEFLHFEWESNKEILSYILLIRDEYSLSYSKENYEHFMKQYQESRYKYNLSLNDLLARLCPEYAYKRDCDYEINFREGTLTIIEREA